MLFYRVPLAVPYWTGATYRAVLRSILRGAVMDGPALHALETSLIKQWNVSGAVLCGSGSLALEIALRACGVRQGDEVVIPAFCCSAVVSPVVAAGAVPVLADVEAELNLTAQTVHPVLTRKTKAIIVPHLFGNPAPIGAIIELAQEKNIRVIDDAAQAVGATIDGKLAGSFGDAGILSFGAEKVCFGLGGGAVLTSGKYFLTARTGFDLTATALGPTLRKLSSIFFWRRWRCWTSPLQHLLSGADLRGAAAAAHWYPRERLANLNAAVALTLLESLDENLAARRARVRAYAELLGDEQSLELVRHQPGSACLSQVVRVKRKRSSEDRALVVIDALAKAGFEVQGSYVPIHHLPDGATCVWDNLPRVEKVWSDLVELPCEPDVGLDQVERIAAIVRAVMS